MKLFDRHLIKKLVVPVLFLGSISAYAQLTIQAEIRPRFEYRNGFKTLRPANDFTPASFVEQRTRLYITYQKDKLKLHIALQDVRMWGNQNQVYKTENNLFNIYEGYGVYQFANKWDFKVGRQALDYDNARFFGNLGWASQGRSHDAFLFRFNNRNGFRTDFGLALNNSGTEPIYLANNAYSQRNYKNMQFIYLQKKWEKTTFTAILQNEGIQKTDSTILANNEINVVYNQTVGATGKGFLGDKFAWTAEFFYQFGETVTGKDLSAYLYSASLTFKTKVTPLTVGIDNLSGTAQGATNNNSFNQKYGTNHKFYGFMDYFYVGNPHGQEGRATGLRDIYFKTKFKLANNHALVGDVHYFMSPVTLYTPSNLTQEISSYLGTEIDLVYIFKMAPAVTLNVGYSHMFANASMEAIKGYDSVLGNAPNNTNNWGWIMLTFKPEIYKSKSVPPAE